MDRRFGGVRVLRIPLNLLLIAGAGRVGCRSIDRENRSGRGSCLFRLMGSGRLEFLLSGLRIEGGVSASENAGL